MADGTVADKSYVLLMEACAAIREERSDNKLLVLLRPFGLLTTFPLPEESAEADMVASRMATQSSAEERKVC